MRLRNERLATGNLLVIFNDPGNRLVNSSIIFLIAGASDIVTSIEIEAACNKWVEENKLSGSCMWYHVADQGDLTSVDPDIAPSGVFRLEAGEFAQLKSEEIKKILGPALDRMVEGEGQLFPSAGGAVGGVAQGVQFLDRETDVQELLGLVTADRSILVTAPRRYGKTSLLRRLESNDELRQNYSILYLDLERYSSPCDMTARLKASVSGQSFRIARRSVEEDKWDEVLSEALTESSRKTSKPLILFLDELVYLLDNLDSHNEEEFRKTVLDVLKRLFSVISRHGAKTVVSGSLDVREFLSESVGLREEIPELFREFKSFALRPLAEDCLKVELRRILVGTGLVPDSLDLEWLAGNVDLAVPYPALRFLEHIPSVVCSQGNVNPRKLEETLIGFLDETDAFREFENHLKRKGEQVPGAGEVASNALSVIARKEASSGESKDNVESLLRGKLSPDESDDIFRWLLETFPIVEENGHLRFASKLWRRWWRRSEGLEE